MQNDTTSLIARGYLPYYEGEQDHKGVRQHGFNLTELYFLHIMELQSEYVAANYNVVTGTNNIDSG